MSSAMERSGLKSKAASFALATSVLFVACSGSGENKTSSPIRKMETPTSTLSPEQEIEVTVIISYYLSSEAPNLPLDENCGHWLIPGDKSTFSSPLPPGDKTLTFEAEVTLQPGISPLFGGLPAVPNTYLKAEIPTAEGVAILPLGKILAVEPARIYFTPYLPGHGIPNKDCIRTHEPLT